MAVLALLWVACDRNRVFNIGNHVYDPQTGRGYATTRYQPKDVVWLIGESHPYIVSQPCPVAVGILATQWESRCWFPDLKVTWRSLNPGVATLDQSSGPAAVVTAIGNGRTTIEASGSSHFQTMHDEMQVHVATPAWLRLQPRELELAVGQPVKLLRMDVIDQAGEVIPSFLNEPCAACPSSDGRSPAPPRVTWTSSNEKVARVSYSDGTERLDRAEIAMLSGVQTWRRAHVYATGPGAATVVGTAFGLSDEIQVTVPEVVLQAPQPATRRSAP